MSVVNLPPAPDAIELRHLRSFVAVAEELNFGRAATRLYLSQPALSRQIRALERLVGCDLLQRSTHRVALTLAGDALLDRARRVLADVDDAVQATRAVGGELVGRMTRLLEPMAAVIESGAGLDAVRAGHEALLAEFPPPEGTQTRAANAGGVPAFVVGSGPDRPPTLLYLHGGGYRTGSAYGYRPLAAALAAAADAVALIPDYRLAPEHPYPAAVDDSLRAYQWMIDGGVRPEEITIAGDSSGGGLVVSVLLAARERGLPRPGRAVLLCPWVDIALELQDDEPGSEPHRLLLRESRAAAGDYLAGHPVDDPVVNAFQADLTGLPPILVQSAIGDPVVSEGHAFVDHARSFGVDIRHQLYPVENHVFHLFWSFLPEAGEALRRAGAFVDEGRATAAGAVSAG